MHFVDTPALDALLQALTDATKRISNHLAQSALNGLLGKAGGQNVQGESQEKLDLLANTLLLDALLACPHVVAVASEEMDNPVTGAHTAGEYLVLFDPLDGSSNLDINMSVGTIFSVLDAQGGFLQAGKHQVAAGYVLYGPSVMMALTTGAGVAFYALDTQGVFRPIKTHIRIAEDTQEYALNISNYRHWLAPMRQYVDECNAGKSGVRGKDFNMRWVAAMVGDVHRILCRGGVFAYPYDTKHKARAGKLRLMYEANPMAFLITQANGRAIDGTNDILDIIPQDIHQRVPVILGARNEVDYIQALHQDAL